MWGIVGIDRKVVCWSRDTVGISSTKSGQFWLQKVSFTCLLLVSGVPWARSVFLYADPELDADVLVVPSSSRRRSARSRGPSLYQVAAPFAMRGSQEPA